MSDAAPTLRDLYSAGLDAGGAGKTIKSCPLDGRTVEGRTWRQGWREGARLRLKLGAAARAEARALLERGTL